MSDDAARHVYVTRTLPDPGVGPLVAGGLVVDQHASDRPPDRDELIAGVRKADGLLCLLTERIDDEVLDASPGLRVIANLAVGYDNIALDATRARGIVVTNTPDVLTEATADLTWALLLAAARRVGEGDRLVRSGAWEGWSPTQLLGSSLQGKILGLFGMGKIGVAVGRRARAFGMGVVYHNRSPNAAGEAATGATWVTFDELLATADVLSVHAPLNDDSRGAIGATALAAMKPSAILINTARGPVVDEMALGAALGAERLAAAGLDVYENEPAVDDELRRLPNVVLLPHLGSATRETRAAMVSLCCENIVAVLAGRSGLTPVP